MRNDVSVQTFDVDKLVLDVTGVVSDIFDWVNRTWSSPSLQRALPPRPVVAVVDGWVASVADLASCHGWKVSINGVLLEVAVNQEDEDTDRILLEAASAMLRRSECVPLGDKPGTEVHCMVCHHEGEQDEQHGPDCALDKLQKRIARYLRTNA